MRVADTLLEDEALLDSVYEAQAQRYRFSRIRGRHQTPAEVVLRTHAVAQARAIGALQRYGSTWCFANSRASVQRRSRMPRWSPRSLECWDRR